MLHGAVLSVHHVCFCLADPQWIIANPQPAAVQHSLLEQPQSCCSSESCQAAGTKHSVPGRSSQCTGFIAKCTHGRDIVGTSLHISLELFKQIKKIQALTGTFKERPTYVYPLPILGSTVRTYRAVSAAERTHILCEGKK